MKKVVIVTGGTDGLGKQIAKMLSPKHQVIILSPTESKLKEVSKELKCDYQVCDISNWQDVKRTVDFVVKKYNKVDCLVNNAALWIQDELDQNDPVAIKRAIEVNLAGTMLMTRSVIPQMKKQKSGLIIIINSQAGFYGKAERSVYNATKWGLTGFTKSLQPELAKYGIGVTGIYPGKMETKMFEKMGIEKDMSNAINTVDVAKVIDYVLDQPNYVLFPEIGIKNING